MSKVYIVSTNYIGANVADKVFGYQPEMIKDFPKDKVQTFGNFINYLSYCELPSTDGNKVYAVHQLDGGMFEKCQLWINELENCFSYEGDEVIFILHDKDILPPETPCQHFYHKAYSVEKRHVYGFQHKYSDLIGDKIGKSYKTAKDFADVIDPVLKIVQQATILRECIDELRYPTEEELNIIMVPGWKSPDDLQQQFPSPDSLDYIYALSNILNNLY